MPDVVFRVILPFYCIVAAVGLIVHRARVVAQTGRDPVVNRPFTETDAPHRYLESALAVGASALALDVLLNAISPRLIQEHFAVSALRTSPRVGWCGLAMVTAGLLVSSAAIMNMATAWRIGIDRDNPGSLVTGGLFRYVRHPIYVGMLLITSGLVVTTADVLSVAVAAASWIGIPLQARMEEEFLSSVYGAEYRRYLADTGRFWPRRRV